MAGQAGAPGLTRALAAFAARAHAMDFGAQALDSARTGFIDTAAVMVAGRAEPVVDVVRNFVLARQSPLAEASVLFGAVRCAAADAARINATAAHALDYDDVGLQGHPSAVLVPALLAEGERLHAGGAALLNAYVVGFETWAELIGRDAQVHHDKGWHPTAVFGIVAAAAAVCALRRLDAERCAHALALAASMAGGLVANFGSMAKPFHAGRAAAGGIEAVELARLGMTGAPDALEHRAGLLAALSPAGAVDRETPASGLGTRLRIESLGLTIKKYPMCFATHRVVDAVLDLVRAHDVQPGQVRGVHVWLGRAQAAMLRSHDPSTALEAKFSLEFAVAAALVARRVGLAELHADFVLREDVRSLYPLVRATAIDTVLTSEPTLAASDRVVIELLDGRRLDSGEVVAARGGPGAPLSATEMRGKFMDCCAGAPGLDASALLEGMRHLETLADVGTLARLAST